MNQNELEQGLIFNPNESKRIRSKFSIRMNQNELEQGLIFNRNESVFGLNIRFRSFRARIDFDSFGLIRISNLRDANGIYRNM